MIINQVSTRCIHPANHEQKELPTMEHTRSIRKSFSERKDLSKSATTGAIPSPLPNLEKKSTSDGSTDRKSSVASIPTRKNSTQSTHRGSINGRKSSSVCRVSRVLPGSILSEPEGLDEVTIEKRQESLKKRYIQEHEELTEDQIEQIMFADEITWIKLTTDEFRKVNVLKSDLDHMVNSCSRTLGEWPSVE
jgi:hypothetical protein